MYALLQAEADTRSLPLPQPDNTQESLAEVNPGQEPRFSEFMTVDNPDDLVFVEGVFRAAEIPYALEEAAGQPGVIRVMVGQDWLEQAGQLFREEDGRRP